LWLALPADQELGPSESIYLEPGDIPASGPVSVLLGRYDGVLSPLKAPAPINYLAVRLQAGERWRYAPPAGHDVAWLALATGAITVPEPVAAGELVAFENGEAPIEIEAQTDSAFVLGSAESHKSDLVLGYYSVHTSPEALAAGERRIADIQHRLQAQGLL
jgi:redox-sensitive bicupin YhaK (pirin superfamily)